ncbi:MAG: glycosyltransferase, partial [Bacteroidales bacterium]|nr:glycosyltransferase [Bacteroidales bacterium]
LVSIIIAVHNEEIIISNKIHSILNSDYPPHLYEIIIGSDASTDNTNAILKKFASDYKNIQVEYFNKRSGKINIINKLAKKAKADLILFTDADIIFTENTIYELIKYFKEPKIALVDSNLPKQYAEKKGIDIQESYYLNFELSVKYKEGIIGGVMMGPSGGAYAIRKKLFVEVPENFLVDDFYINMKILEKNYWSINNPAAIAYDNGTDEIDAEFKRKIRISTGNFQNLAKFSNLLFSKRYFLAFSFFSHKILRWLTPLFIILLIISSLMLYNISFFYQILTILLFFSLSIPFIDYFLRKNGFHIILLRFISHYYYMNLGLFLGLIKYIKGVKSNVWEPTKRRSKTQ